MRLAISCFAATSHFCPFLSSFPHHTTQPHLLPFYYISTTFFSLLRGTILTTSFFLSRLLLILLLPPLPHEPLLQSEVELRCLRSDFAGFDGNVELNQAWKTQPTSRVRSM